MTYRIVRRPGRVELQRSSGNEWLVLADGESAHVMSVASEMAAEARKRERAAREEAKALEQALAYFDARPEPTAESSELDARTLLELQAEHSRGRRAVRRGDVFEARGGSRATVLAVDRPSQRRGEWWDGNTQLGTAHLEWSSATGARRLSARKVSSLRTLKLVSVGAELDEGPAARHRQGLRSVRVGDVLRDTRRGRDAVVGEIGEMRVRLDWLDSGRSSRRAVNTLRWLALVREGATAPASGIAVGGPG